MYLIRQPVVALGKQYNLGRNEARLIWWPSGNATAAKALLSPSRIIERIGFAILDRSEAAELA